MVSLSAEDDWVHGPVSTEARRNTLNPPRDGNDPDFTARCTCAMHLVQSTVLPSQVVNLSVCL